MAANGQGRQNAYNKRQTTYSRNYVTGSAVRQPEAPKRLTEAPKRKVSHSVRRNRDKMRHMNFAYVLFLAGALVFAGTVLISYLRLQANITGSVENIAKLESQLNNMRMENDEALNRIQRSIDLEEIKRIAISELGMTYAREGQIIEFSAEGSDYVRQVAEISD